MDCKDRVHPKRLIPFTVYHIESPTLGCDRPMLYLGFTHPNPAAGVSQGWQFLPIGWDPVAESVWHKWTAIVEPNRRGKKEHLLTHSHLPDGGS